MRVTIPYTKIHDEACALLDYVSNFLLPDAPTEQLMEEVRISLTKIATLSQQEKEATK